VEIGKYDNSTNKTIYYNIPYNLCERQPLYEVLRGRLFFNTLGVISEMGKVNIERKDLATQGMIHT